MTKKSLTAKIAGAVVALSFALGTALPAQAQTIADLQALIAQLQAQIAALSGGTTGGSMSCNYVFTQNLTIGSTGVEVMNLQKLLNMNANTQVSVSGPGSPGMETSYFGPATRAAVIKFQNMYSSEILAPVGLNMGTGFVGPSTRAKLNTMCSTMTPGTPTTPGTPATPGTGTEGYMTVTLNSSPNNTTVDEGQTKDVASARFEAFNSDMTINRVDVNFSKRPWLYLSKIELLIDGNVVWSDDSLSAGDFIEQTAGSDYRLRATGFNETVAKGSRVNIVVRVTAKATIDSNRISDSVNVTFKSNSIRATDTKGLSHEEPNSDLAVRTFKFKAQTTGNVEATINSSSPKERWVKVTDAGETKGVELMRFDLEAKQQAIDVNELRFALNTSGPDAASIYNDVYLADSSGNKLESASTIATTTVFTTLDHDYFKISKDSKKTFRLMVDVKDTDDATVIGTVASSSLVANTTNIVAEDEQFNQPTVGSVTLKGNDVHFNNVIANVSNQSASFTGLGNNDYLANVSFTFTLTADGGNVYVSKTPSTFVSTSTTASSASLVSVSAGTAPGDTSAVYEITSGASRTFTFSGSMNNLNGTAGTKKMNITAIKWGKVVGSPAAFTTDFELDALEVNATLTAN